MDKFCQLFFYFRVLTSLIVLGSVLADPLYANKETLKDYYPTNWVTLVALDKVLGRSIILKESIHKRITVGNLLIFVQQCLKSYTGPFSAAFLSIYQIDSHNLSQKKFSGWMFSRFPACNALEDPMYDIWIHECHNGHMLSDDRSSKGSPQG